MGKFYDSYHDYKTTEGFVADIVDEFVEGNNITVVAGYDEMNQILKYLFMTGLFTPYSIDFHSYEWENYYDEYVMSVNGKIDEGSEIEDGEVYCEKLYRDGRCVTIGEANDIIICSANISDECLEALKKQGCRIAIFKICD